MKNLVALACLPVLLGACAASGPNFVTAAESHGLRQVALGEVVYTGCGNDQSFARRFTAVDGSGAKVDGMVCGALMGPTVMAAPAGQQLARLAPGQIMTVPVAVASGS